MGWNPVRTWIFSGLIFTTSSVVFITLRIASIFVSSTAVHMYDFHIFIVMCNQKLFRFCAQGSVKLWIDVNFEWKSGLSQFTATFNVGTKYRFHRLHEKTKRTFTFKTIPNIYKIARTVVWALGISARWIWMESVHFDGMSLAAFVNVWEKTINFLWVYRCNRRWVFDQSGHS